MRLNCELPICMLEWNHKINDYDFILQHLLEHEGYREYFTNRPFKRMSILDNSGYEYAVRGLSLDWDKYVETIKLIKPTYYLIPDVLGDFEKTVVMVKEWKENYQSRVPFTPMPVIQGSTINELRDCLVLYKDLGYDAVAIPFDIDAFESEQGNKKSRAIGRHAFCKVFESGLSRFKYAHLLGSHDWREPSFYYSSGPDSMDTSYPVKCGYLGVDMDKDKPNILIDDFIDEQLSEVVKNRIIDNIKRFRRQ